MAVTYDSFRAKTWAERLEIFNGIGEERAGLVREHISRWLTAHRNELTAAQIEVLLETIAAIDSDLYAAERSDDLLVGMKDLETRASELLSRDQMRQALTMHW